MRNNVDAKIAEIHEFVEKHVKGEHIKHYDAATYMQEVILPFNASVIEVLMGRTPVLDDKTGSFKLKGRRAVPNKLQLMNLMKEVLAFDSVRNIYEVNEKSDMELRGVLNVTPFTNPLSEKELNVLIGGLIGSDLGSKDFAQIAMLGEIQHAAFFKKKVMLTGIISVLAAIGIAFFYGKYKSKKVTDEEVIEEEPAVEESTDVDPDDVIVNSLPKVEEEE